MIEGRLPSAVRGRRGLAALITVALVLALLPGLAAAEDRLNMTVLEGADNVAAAIAWSKLSFPEGETTTNAILGRDDLPPDNLASGMLQGALDGPLLLNPTNTLNSAVKAELERLEIRVVHILGGTSAISTTVENALKAEGYAVRRYSGASRLETAQDVARQHGGAATTAFLARAFGTSSDQTSAWADALAGGAWAADEGFPVLFTQTETLTASTRDYLQTSRIRTVIILGGTGAVSSAVESQLQALGITVRRVSGATRFATATEIAEERGFDDAGDATSIVLADGQTANGWAAGFAAAGYAADKPIVLSNGNSLPTETDTWFAGGSSTDNLIVAPYVADAAATAAADKLDLGKKATVTVDTSVASNEDITGTVSPMDDVKTVAIEGDCVADDDDISPNATSGAFSVPLTSTENGTCDLTITVTYDNGDKTVHELTVTISGPGPNATAMDGPELTTADVSNTTATHVVVRYIFDETVSLLTPDAPAESRDFFELVAFDGTIIEPDHPLDEDPVRQDAGRILVSYLKDEYNRATTAVVLPGAVKDISGLSNPEGSAALRSVSFSAGQTIGPDLIGFSKESVNKGDSNIPNWVVRVTYEFDEVAWLSNEAEYQLVMKNGDEHDMEAMHDGDGTTKHIMEIGNDAAARFANTKSGADGFGGNIARVWVNYTDAETDTYAVSDAEGIPNIAHTFGTTALTSLPYITSVSLSPTTNTARIVFNEDVTVEGAAATFFVYNHNGEVTPATNADEDVNDDKAVILSFGTPVVDGQTTGVGHESGAVASTNQNTDMARFQTRTPSTNSAHSFGSGTTLAPNLVSVKRTSSSDEDPFGGSTVTEYTVTFKFDRNIYRGETPNPDETKFKAYSKDDSEGTPFVADQCEMKTTATATTEIVCTVDDEATNFAAVADAVVFAVERGAVTAESPEGDDLGYVNHPSSRVRS